MRARATRDDEGRDRLPTFLFIGPDKSGSTWLHRVLQEHPDCFVPALKDLFFFDRYFDRGMDWYLAHFSHAPPGAKAIGEISHDYLFSPLAADRIREHLPRVTLLSTLRDPVERSFSQYLFMVRSGGTSRTFEDALEHHPVLIENSLYGKHLTTYFDRFPREQIHVFDFDRLREDAAGFARQIFGALGVEDLPNFDYDRPVLPAGKPRWPAMNRLLRGSANTARRLGWSGLVVSAKKAAATSWLSVPYAEWERPKPAVDTVDMLRDRFAPDLSCLRRLLTEPHPRWLSQE